MINQLQGIEDSQTLAEAIVDTIHEPFIVLDAQFRVLAASRSFYETFEVDSEHTIGSLLYACLGNLDAGGSSRQSSWSVTISTWSIL